MVLAIIVKVISILFSILNFALLAYCVMSFLPGFYGSTVYRILDTIVSPLLAPIRTLLHKIPALSNLPLDFSPIVAFMLLGFLQRLLYILIL